MDSFLFSPFYFGVGKGGVLFSSVVPTDVFCLKIQKGSSFCFWEESIRFSFLLCFLFSYSL